MLQEGPLGQQGPQLTFLHYEGQIEYNFTIYISKMYPCIFKLQVSIVLLDTQSLLTPFPSLLECYILTQGTIICQTFFFSRIKLYCCFLVKRYPVLTQFFPNFQGTVLWLFLFDFMLFLQDLLFLIVLFSRSFSILGLPSGISVTLSNLLL